MTLQQKMLAKQSKKGFTLVELVVVIAILGILAAIAIPAVIGIINSANESQAKTDAASLSAACKNYYAEIIAGTINSTNKGGSSDTLPAKNASAASKKTTAGSCTVKGAMEYYGLTDLSSKLGDFVGDSKTGTIYAKVDGNKPSNATVAIAEGTNLSALGYGDTVAASTPAATSPAAGG